MSGKLICDAIAKTRQIKFLVQHLHRSKVNHHYSTDPRSFSRELIAMLLFAAYNSLTMIYEAKREVH
jgi:hypothetical protein